MSPLNPRPNFDRSLKDSFLSDLAESKVRVRVEDLKLLSENGALISADEPAFDRMMTIWWTPKLLIADAYEDLNGDEAATILKLMNGALLVWWTNFGSGIPFDMATIERL